MEISMIIFIIFSIAISSIAVYAVTLIFGIGTGRLYNNQFTPINRKSIFYNDYKNSRFGVLLFLMLVFLEGALAGFVFKQYVTGSTFTGLMFLSLFAIIYDDNSKESARIDFLIKKFDEESNYVDELSKYDKYYAVFKKLEEEKPPVVLGKYDEIEDLETFILVSSMPKLDEKLLEGKYVKKSNNIIVSS